MDTRATREDAMPRDTTYTRATSLLLVAAGAAAGFALFTALRPRTSRQSSGPAAGLERRPQSRLKPPTPRSDEETIERRVLEVFRNDLILSERAIDICAIESGGVELTGWVSIAAEVGYAVTLARGVPGVSQVVDHLAVRGREPARNHSTGNYAAIDPSAATAEWPSTS